MKRHFVAINFIVACVNILPLSPMPTSIVGGPSAGVDTIQNHHFMPCFGDSPRETRGKLLLLFLVLDL